MACDPAEVKKFASWMEEIVIKTTVYFEEGTRDPEEETQCLSKNIRAVIFLAVKSAFPPEFSLCQVKNVFVFASRLREGSLSLSFGSYPFHVSLASLDSSPDVTKRSFAGYSYCRYLSVQSTKFLFWGY